MSQNEAREHVRDYLNETITELTKYEQQLMNYFDIDQCECGNFELSEDMVDTEGMINGGIGYICQQCKEELE